MPWSNSALLAFLVVVIIVAMILILILIILIILIILMHPVPRGCIINIIARKRNMFAPRWVGNKQVP